MKKLLLIALIASASVSAVFAQARWQTNDQIGQVLTAVNPADKDTFVLHFNTTRNNTTWAVARATANLGKDSISWQKAQTQRGIQAKGFLNNVITSAYENNNLRSNNAGGNGNPGRVHSIDSLKNILSKSIGVSGVAAVNGNVIDSITRPAACLFDVSANDQAFGLYPGKTTKIEYVFRFDYQGKTCTDDISFEMWTYDAGTTGNSAVYQLAVYTSSTFSEANRLGNLVNVYTTGTPKKTVNLASEIGVNHSAFTNKSLYIVIHTLGTNGDGIAHAVDANNVPTFFDPTVVFDNFYMTYQSPVFLSPITTATATNYVNYNNGAPEIKAADAGLSNPGTAKPIATNVVTPVTISLKSTNRVGAFSLIENLSYNANITFDAETAFKANDGAGNYDVPVVAVQTVNVTNQMRTLTIAAPTAGTSVNDDMEFTFNVIRPTDGNTTLRFEISNGSARLWYDFLFTASTTTNVDNNVLSPIGISTSRSSISILNATEMVSIFSLSGQKVADLSVKSSNTITVSPGVYIVKHANEVRKVVVK